MGGNSFRKSGRDVSRNNGPRGEKSAIAAKKGERRERGREGEKRKKERKEGKREKSGGKNGGQCGNARWGYDGGLSAAAV